MEIQKLIKSAGFMEFINKLDNLINNLLYSQDEGFVKLTSKDALDNAQNLIDKFNYESDKLSKEYSYPNVDEIIKNKRFELTAIIRQHTKKQALIWAQDVFEESVENLLFKASINADNKEETLKIYQDIKTTVLWISEIFEYNDKEKENLLSGVMKKLNNALNSSDSDFISLSNPDRTNYSVFLKLFNLILSDNDAFLSTNLQNYKEDLSQEDLNYFQKIQNSAKQNKTKILDELNLINYALNKLKSNKEEDKYNFIIQVRDSLSDVKDDSDENIAKLIKNRLLLFENKNRYLSGLFGF